MRCDTLYNKYLHNSSKLKIVNDYYSFSIVLLVESSKNIWSSAEIATVKILAPARALGSVQNLKRPPAPIPGPQPGNLGSEPEPRAGSGAVAISGLQPKRQVNGRPLTSSNR
ncbi:unnamed protein product [Bursaphelenchus xylophilus]|uniref:(pine wood nematode) hypothetical protein n=1 Tax=Bursaphelenchus xylophilus TaxID=6326 RepID=A0A1I7S2C0_BURXY|nr:unnamed protein product [Bursaphelenchus xylophilus]CAG9114692.1 unnamed protein product [Bursaphelenchus xylophilus]